MIAKLLSWWSGETYVKEIKVKQPEELNEEYRYETTLVRDLKIISELLGKPFPRETVSYFHTHKDKGIVRFHTRDISKADVRKKVNLKSLTITGSYDNINSYFWEADYEEYQRVYESKYMSYANIVRKLLGVVVENFKNEDYYYTFCKYEDSIFIVANTLKDEYENNDWEISQEIFDKSERIINRFGRAFVEKHKELEHIKELQKEAVRKNLVNRLDEEMDFMDKYIEVQ